MNIKIKIESEGYETELNEYLNNSIEYSASSLKYSDVEDLQQLASDSFFAGARFKNNELGNIVLKVLKKIENNEEISYRGMLHLEIGKFVYLNGITDAEV